MRPQKGSDDLLMIEADRESWIFDVLKFRRAVSCLSVIAGD